MIGFAINKIHKHWNNPYRGAGILFVCQPKTGPTEFFLAKRHRKPVAGQWSIVGGEQEKIDDGNFLHTAIREASEETCGGTDLRLYLRDFLPEPVGAHGPVRRTNWIWYRWQTFVVRLDPKPPSEYWPLRNAAFLYEFSDAGWFSTAALPTPVYSSTLELIRLVKKQ